MRVLTTLLAAMMLVLSCLPCADISERYHVHKEYSPAHEHQEHDGTADYCSPFCHCACCGTVYTSVQDVIIFPEAAPSVSAPVYTCDIPGSLRDVSFSVWQPPRIV